MLSSLKSLLIPIGLSLSFSILHAEENRTASTSTQGKSVQSSSRFMLFPHDREFVYKTVDKFELKCFVYDPENHDSKKSKAPAIVLFFGGGWAGGTTDHASAFCDFFSKHGIVAIAPDYRVTKRTAKSPKDCVKDAKSAIRWVKENHKELGIDPEKVIAGGFSSGGHIAAAAGTDIKFDDKTDDLSISAKPVALVLYNPVYDNGPGQFGHNQVKAYWKKFSPRHNLDKTTPPTIVFLGDKDQHVPVETAQDYQKAMKKLRVKSDLHIYEKQKHGFMNLLKVGERNPYFDITTEEALKFLDSLDLVPAK